MLRGRLPLKRFVRGAALHQRCRPAGCDTCGAPRRRRPADGSGSPPRRGQAAKPCCAAEAGCARHVLYSAFAPITALMRRTPAEELSSFWMVKDTSSPVYWAWGPPQISLLKSPMV